LKQYKPDESDLSHLRQDVLRLTRIEAAMLTDGGKEILALLKDREQAALNDLTSRDIAGLNESMLIAWPYIHRGKLQVLRDLIRYLESSSIERERITRELAQYDNPSKGEK
jgi:hypothetical protein